MNKFAIEVRNLSFSYGKKAVLHELNFGIKRGFLCGLLGPNGSGKSTFFRCCLNFLSPNSGEIYINGQNSSKLTPSKMAKLIAYVPQDSDSTFAFSVLEIVLMGRSPYLGGIFGLKDEDYLISRDVLKKVGISHLENEPFNALSGGQRQLVLIARALAQQAPIIILDEPTSALDFKNQIQIWNLLKEISQTGVTLLVCTHEPNHILWFCDELVAFAQGRVVASGETRSIMDNEFITQIYGENFDIARIKSQRIIHPILSDLT